MKLALTVTMMILIQNASAESAYEKRKKQEMLSRLDAIIKIVKDTRGHAKKDQAKEACDGLKELMKLLPEHLKAVGSQMNNGKTKVVIARDEVLTQLIFVHRQTTVCERGENAEHVDTRDLAKKMKKIAKNLRNQKKLIAKEETDFANDFSYHYEF